MYTHIFVRGTRPERVEYTNRVSKAAGGPLPTQAHRPPPIIIII